ncbi:cellular nucleic acid-binding protein homolog [Lactuca sativa]|uniref:cellular nucleic acid-binding protein homolog n=1 Tax=Lactuca sativa TaxID=4236 RepID=UPI000CD97694|nr:cellular nucleic acid-binding protein homolog [Lactuca sativa]
MFSRYGGVGEATWCDKYGRKHNGRCPKEVICFKCGKIGHYAHECSIEEEVCIKCSKEGHYKKEFPVRVTKSSVPLKNFERCDEDVTCYKCGKTGHYANKCVSKKRVCYECWGEGHLSRDCPKKNEGAKPNALPQPKAEAF